MGNRIVYGNYTFNDDVIMNAQITLANAMVSESLAADEFKFTVYSTQTSDFNYLRTVLQEYYTTVNDEHFGIYVGAISSYTYGAPIYYYKDNVLQGKYYVSRVTRTGKYTFQFDCVSAVGLLIKINHNGGVYENSNTTVGSLVRGIFSKVGLTENTDYIIDNAVDGVPVNGWLPYASCRDNLRQILFAVGASIVKEDTGKISIKYISSPTLKNIPDERIYLGGDVNYLTPASSVEVWEHEYHAVSTDQLKLLFDNSTETTATNELITFEKPMHPDILTHQWVITGNLTVSEIGANYAIVSGLGTLSGYEYSHTTRVLTEVISNTGQKNVVTVKDATLVSTLNSTNVTKRVAAYYSQAKEIACDIVMSDDDLKPSSKVSFTDLFGDSRVGYIKSMNVAVSKTDKASSVISIDWTPSHFGNNYSNSILLSSGTTWTSPITGTVRIVLIGGGQGGQGGYNGTAGSNTKAESGNSKKFESGGLGGAKGSGGNGGKIFTFDINVTEGTTYTFSLGIGGNGGASNGGVGSNGTNTTITIGGTTYSSGNGVINNNGHINVLTGDIYGLKGWDGIKGADSQQDTSLIEIYNENASIQISNNESIEVVLRSGNTSLTKELNQGHYLPRVTVYGANGGGGALGVQGGNANEPQYQEGSQSPYADFHKPADGGDGSNAMTTEAYLNSIGKVATLSIGQGGLGGNGAGGGAGAGNANGTSSTPYVYVISAEGGTGGLGSAGCNGANGGILIYY